MGPKVKVKVILNHLCTGDCYSNTYSQDNDKASKLKCRASLPPVALYIVVVGLYFCVNRHRYDPASWGPQPTRGEWLLTGVTLTYDTKLPPLPHPSSCKKHF